MINAQRLISLLVLLGLAAGCRHAEQREMLVTAYCGCGECNGYERGSWRYLKLDFWNRYNNYDPVRGTPYTGRTASGTRPHPPRPGLASLDSLRHPWMIPVRLVFPWLWLPRRGTIAADRDHYPFGTEMYVPGWGWGVVEDVGGAIQGPAHIDIFMRRHRRTERWGRQHLSVEIDRE